MRALMVALVASLFAWGCDNAGPTEPAPVVTKVDPTPPPVEKKPEPVATDDQIPTPSDFEEEAETDITSSNLDEELEKLEREIEGG